MEVPLGCALGKGEFGTKFKIYRPDIFSLKTKKATPRQHP